MTATKCALLLPLLRALRWLLFIGALSFVIMGWVNSILKYLDGHTSISFSMQERERHLYPSITFCPGYKLGFDLREEIYKTGAKHMSEVNLSGLIEQGSVPLESFLEFFTHPEANGPSRDFNLVNNRSAWERRTPHPTNGGTCHTYHPSHRALPGQWYGIMFSMKFPDLESAKDKRKFLSTLEIYLHDKGHFDYFKEENMPSAIRLEPSSIKLNKLNSVVIEEVSDTALDLPNRPCEESVDYSFHYCTEQAFSSKRGCQPPWYHFNQSNIPLCNDIQVVREVFSPEQEWSRPFWPQAERRRKSGCLLPCHVSKFNLQYTFEEEQWNMSPDADVAIILWYKNFLFTQKLEYVICDSTCLLGEIGGNLGFFLGGSILGYCDLILTRMKVQIA